MGYKIRRSCRGSYYTVINSIAISITEQMKRPFAEFREAETLEQINHGILTQNEPPGSALTSTMSSFRFLPVRVISILCLKEQP